MKSNVGTVDKLVRLTLAVVIIVLFYLGVFSTVFGLVMLGLALVLAITSLVGYCGLYRIFGINTCKAPKKDN